MGKEHFSLHLMLMSMPGKVSGAKRIDHEGHQPQNKAMHEQGTATKKIMERQTVLES